jgi:uncharacterized protein YdaU (DUF1376 family)
MSSPAWMPLYIADYIADTMHLGALEHGAYLMLIMQYWRVGSLPDDDRKLARIAKCTDREWRAIKGTIADLFDEGWTHKRIDYELEKALEKSDARADAGRRGAEAKLLKEKERLAAIARNLPQQKSADALASSSPSPSTTSSQSSDVCPKRVRTKYPDDFEVFWEGYPTDANMSKKEAHDIWRRMPADARSKAMASLPAFRAHCSANPDYRPIHACRYLTKERYEGFAAVAEKTSAAAGVYLRQGDPGWTEWQSVKRTPTDKNGGWWFPSQFPSTVPAHAA